MLTLEKTGDEYLIQHNEKAIAQVSLNEIEDFFVKYLVDIIRDDILRQVIQDLRNLSKLLETQWLTTTSREQSSADPAM